MAQQDRPAAVFSDSYVPDWSFALIEWDNPPGPKKRPDGTIRSVNRVNRSTVARWAEKRKVWERKSLVLPRPGSETVIMCLAWGYPIATFRRFVGSLRAHYRGDVAMLLAGQPPPEIHEYLVANRVTQVPVAPIPDHALHRFSDFAALHDKLTQRYKLPNSCFQVFNGSRLSAELYLSHTQRSTI